MCIALLAQRVPKVRIQGVHLRNTGDELGTERIVTSYRALIAWARTLSILEHPYSTQVCAHRVRQRAQPESCTGIGNLTSRIFTQPMTMPGKVMSDVPRSQSRARPCSAYAQVAGSSHLGRT